MAQLLFANNATTTLAGAITPTSLAIAVSAGSGVEFPSPVLGQSYFCGTLVDAATGLLNEIVWVTARSNDILTVARGQENTTALNWNAGDLFSNLLTAGSLGQFLQIGVDPPDNFAIASMTSSTANGITTNAYAITWNLTQTLYAQGNPQGLVYFTNANTSTTCTLNDGTGARPLLRADGLPPGVATSVTGADVSGYCFVFNDGSAWRFSDLLTITDVLALIAPPIAARTNPVTVLSGSYTATAADQNRIFAFGGSANGTFTLPNPTSLINGWSVTIDNNTGYVLALTTPSGQIQGTVTAQTQYIQRNQSISIATDGTNWYLAFGGNISNRSVAAKSAAYTVSPTDQDKLLIYNGSGAATFGLPSPSAVYNGFVVSFLNVSASVLTLNSGSANISNPSSTGNTFALYPGQSVVLVCDGSNWFFYGGYYAPKASVGASGYLVRPDGKIEQWGFVTSSGTAGSGVSVAFPLSFPTNVETLNIQVLGATAGQTAANTNASGFNFVSSMTNTGHYWRAVGS